MYVGKLVDTMIPQGDLSMIREITRNVDNEDEKGQIALMEDKLSIAIRA
jgi:hypothetical protein